jgi:autotransporter-associated beta strand protein
VVQNPPAGQSDDRQALVADSNPNSPFANNIYTIWTRFGIPAPSTGTEVFIGRSANQGATWNVVQVGDSNGPDNSPNTADDEGFGQQMTIHVAPNGDVYGAYHAQPGFVAGQTSLPDGTSGQVIVVRSTDGGLTFPQKTLAFGAGQADITFNRQENGTTGNLAGTRFLTQGSVQPVVLADQVRPQNIYVFAVDDPDNNHGNGDDADLVFARSTDNGNTWTQQTIQTGPPGGSYQLFPTANVDQFGNIIVGWYDNRRGQTNAAGNFLFDFFAMYSTDGGQTFSAPFMINDSANPFDPDETPTTAFQGGTTTRIGEYFGMDLFGGTGYVVWNGNTPGDATTSQQPYFDAFAIAGALTVTGDDSGVANDNIEIRNIATNTDFMEVLVNGQRQYAGLLEALSGGVTINGLGGSDNLTVDFTSGFPTPTGSLTYNGGGGTSDSLTLTGGGPFSSIVHNFTNANDGNVNVDGNTINYTGLEPITDNLPAVNRTFNFNGGTETITLSDDGGASNNKSFIDSTAAESVTFVNPSGAMNVNAGSGDDTVNINGLDSSFSADLTVNGDAGTDTVTFQINSLNIGNNDLQVSAESVNINNGSIAAGTQTYNGPVTLGADTTLTSNSSGAISFNSTVESDSTPRALTVSTSGTTTFAGSVGSSNPLASLTTNPGGTTAINGGSVTTVGDQNYSDGAILGSNTTLTAEDVVFSSAVDNGGNSLTVNVSGTTSEANGAISGSGTLSKNGTGRLALNAANTYTGDTTINGGTLLVNGSTAAASDFTVNSGATLGGTGTIGGTVTVNSGGTVAPGQSPGILSTGSVTFNGGSNFSVELAGTTAGTGYDRLKVTGTVALNNPNLNLNLSFTPTPGNRFTIIDNDGTSDPVTGTFNGLAEEGIATVGSSVFYTSYIDGDGNDVVLTLLSNHIDNFIKGTPGRDHLNGTKQNDLIQGLGGDDNLVGNPGDDVLLGGQGNDKLIGNGGDDFLLGGAGDDDLNGNEGNDILNGGTGNDNLKGGEGSDTFIFAGLFGDDTIWNFAEGVDRLDISAFSSFLPGGFGSLDTNSDGIFNALDNRASFFKGQLVADLTFGGPTGGTITLQGVSALTAVDFIV